MGFFRSPSMDLKDGDDLVSHDFLEFQTIILQVFNPLLKLFFAFDCVETDSFTAFPIAIHCHFLLCFNL